jgi:sulfofructose kinase
LSLTQSKDPGVALLEIARQLPTAKVIGVTLGERGSLVWQANAKLPEGGSTVFVEAMKIKSIDTLGAGDVWHAAYCYGLVSGLGLPRTIEFANTAGAMKCEQLWGRLGAPSLEQVQQRMKSQRTKH